MERGNPIMVFKRNIMKKTAITIFVWCVFGAIIKNNIEIVKFL